MKIILIVLPWYAYIISADRSTSHASILSKKIDSISPALLIRRFTAQKTRFLGSGRIKYYPWIFFAPSFHVIPLTPTRMPRLKDLVWAGWHQADRGTNKEPRVGCNYCLFESVAQTDKLKAQLQKCDAY